ncbi:unnamed protein product, partial [Prorocentrum cordatum]
DVHQLRPGPRVRAALGARGARARVQPQAGLEMDGGAPFVPAAGDGRVLVLPAQADRRRQVPQDGQEDARRHRGARQGRRWVRVCPARGPGADPEAGRDAELRHGRDFQVPLPAVLASGCTGPGHV